MVAKIAKNGCDRDRSRVSIIIGDVIDTRDLSLSQPFLAILATIAYNLWPIIILLTHVV